MDDRETTQPDDQTVQADEEEARAAHQADRPPTAEEEQAAPGAPSPGTAEHYEEMAERGANEKGEGRLP